MDGWPFTILIGIGTLFVLVKVGRALMLMAIDAAVDIYIAAIVGSAKVHKAKVEHGLEDVPQVEEVNPLHTASLPSAIHSIAEAAKSFNSALSE
jgi:hypothetical protein